MLFASIALVRTLTSESSETEESESPRELGQQALERYVDALGEMSDEATTCAVCLEAIHPGQGARKLPCSHCFHRACILDSWS